MLKRILSLTNRVWNIYEDEDRAADWCRSSDIIRSILNSRGITNVETFKNVTLKNTMPDPFVFLDMKKAIDRIVDAIISGEKVAILGDYDVDGVSSTVLMMNFLKYLQIPCEYSIPNRIDEGYGINVEKLKKYKDHLIVTVDCGSSSFEELRYAQDENIDVIVIDHHKMTRMPEAVAIVNPHRPDESGKYQYLCAAGMVFMFIVGINRELRNRNFYNSHSLKEPNLSDYLDMVALATVCDVMPLIDLNRAFVIYGIKAMLKRKNPGIAALIDLNKTSDISSETIAFSFGPKINAAGRLASADISVKLFMTQNSLEAKELAERLDKLNSERQKLEQRIIEEAIENIDENLNFICVHSDKWHTGIVGIVAGRLKETYHKPSFVISVDKNGNGRGSCRSVSGVNISEIINKGIEKNIISSGGGHEAAAGFCIPVEKIDEFIEFLKDEIKYEVSQDELYADCCIPASAISFDLMKELSYIGPFGNGNKNPKFVIKNLRISSAKLVGKNHIQVLLENEESGKLLNAIAFRCADTPLGKILLCNRQQSIQILGTLSASEWKGKKYISIFVEDISDNNSICK
ncbi:MAG: single-stranded-DNA-specific exonuclease RecJ [Alphaproteobacteria bacterium]|nr:single-stranded-DNA-specific exonuclease RecJ [Alphaproteobacteria bacterium]